MIDSAAAEATQNIDVIEEINASAED